MNRYELLLTLHVVGVVAWLGAATVLGVATIASPGVLDLRQVTALGRWLGPRLFLAAWIAVLGAGIGLVQDGSWTFDPLWIRLGLGALAASLLLNVTARRATLLRVSHAFRAPTVDGSRLDVLHRRLRAVALVDLTLLYLAVADMTSKPSGADVWTLVVGGSALALVVLGAAVSLARGRPA
ncbi:MAG: hypothetical protein M3322_04650 [Actinomycetota bacterium]|nr:hypothetical protein [Actinomycetota bacterium]